MEELRRILAHLRPNQEVLLDQGGVPCPVQAVFLRHGGVELSAGPPQEQAAEQTPLMEGS